MKYAVVTGHESGMGKAAAEALSRAGYHVTGWDITGSPKADVSSSADVAKAVSEIKEPLDAVILAAGVWMEASLLDTTDDDWNNMMNINAFGVFNCIRALLPHMKPGGAIAIVISASGLFRIFCRFVFGPVLV